MLFVSNIYCIIIGLFEFICYQYLIGGNLNLMQVPNVIIHYIDNILIILETEK